MRVCVCSIVTPQPVGQRRIYVGSLDYTVTDAIIRALFQPFGSITNVDMPFDPAYATLPLRACRDCRCCRSGFQDTVSLPSVACVVQGRAQQGLLLRRLRRARVCASRADQHERFRIDGPEDQGVGCW